MKASADPASEEIVMTAATTPLSPPPGGSPVARFSPIQEFLARRPAWQVCYLAGICAGILVEAWGLIAREAGVPMRAAGEGSHHASPVTVGMFAMGVMVVTFWYTFVVVVLARFAKRPARTFLLITLPLLVLSLAAPGTAADTAISTKVTLAVAHLIAAAVIVPTVAKRLARAR